MLRLRVAILESACVMAAIKSAVCAIYESTVDTDQR